MTMQRTLKLYKLPEKTRTAGFRKMVAADLPRAHRLLAEVKCNLCYWIDRIMKVIILDLNEQRCGAHIQYKVYANYKFILIKFHKISIHEQILCCEIWHSHSRVVADSSLLTYGTSLGKLFEMFWRHYDPLKCQELLTQWHQSRRLESANIVIFYALNCIHLWLVFRSVKYIYESTGTV